MNDPNQNQIREASWRRKWTAAEEAAWRAWLEAHPEARPDLEADRRLTEALGGLPDVPVPSNFTARVLQAVEHETAPAGRPGARGLWRALLPRAALASGGVLAVAAVVGLVLQRQQAEARQMAQSVAVVAEVSSLPGPEVLQDFDAILQLNASPRPDAELLALLQ